MKSLDNRGDVNVLLIPLIVLLVAFMGVAAFAVWAYTDRSGYKDKSDQKVAAAVSKTQQDTQVADAAKYAEEAKKPFDTYIGPAAFGNITVKYPKTWSAYMLESPSGGSPVSGYFHPNYVPSTQNAENAFALRLELVQQNYDSAIAQYGGLVTAKKITVTPFKLAKVPSVVGVKIEGQIKSTKQGTMVILPLRNMTLEVWTESNSFKADLENSILPNLTFVP